MRNKASYIIPISLIVWLFGTSIACSFVNSLIFKIAIVDGGYILFLIGLFLWLKKVLHGFYITPSIRIVCLYILIYLALIQVFLTYKWYALFLIYIIIHVIALMIWFKKVNRI